MTTSRFVLKLPINMVQISINGRARRAQGLADIRVIEDRGRVLRQYKDYFSLPHTGGQPQPRAVFTL